jgi:hypothetical protein
MRAASDDRYLMVSTSFPEVREFEFTLISVYVTMWIVSCGFAIVGFAALVPYVFEFIVEPPPLYKIQLEE